MITVPYRIEKEYFEETFKVDSYLERTHCPILREVRFYFLNKSPCCQSEEVEFYNSKLLKPGDVRVPDKVEEEITCSKCGTVHEVKALTYQTNPFASVMII